MSRQILTGRVLPCGTYTKVGDMTWPSYEQGDLEWQLRYGSEQQVVAARMRLASIVGAYDALLSMPANRRNDICRAIREAQTTSTRRPKP